MNKTELIDVVAAKANLSKKDAGAAVGAALDAIAATLGKGQEVAIVGFGTFAVGTRKARTGRNPSTGEAIKIKASRAPKFKPGKALKDLVNKKK